MEALAGAVFLVLLQPSWPHAGSEQFWHSPPTLLALLTQLQGSPANLPSPTHLPQQGHVQPTASAGTSAPPHCLVPQEGRRQPYRQHARNSCSHVLQPAHQGLTPPTSTPAAAAAKPLSQLCWGPAPPAVHPQQSGPSHNRGVHAVSTVDIPGAPASGGILFLGPIGCLLAKTTAFKTTDVVDLLNREQKTQRVRQNKESEICSKWKNKTKPQRKN